jgi:ABC-2 type transport system permease protein
VLQSYLDQVNADQAATVVLGPQEKITQDNVQSPDAVTIGSLKETGQPYSAVQYYSTSMLIMFLLFSGMSMSISLLQERETHTLARLHSLPLSFNQILLGKLLGNMLISLVQAVIIVCFTAWVYKVDWGNHLLLVFIVCVLTIIASMCIGILLATIVKSSKSVNTLHSSIITAMTFLSGGMIPYLGETLEKLGHFTVNYWAYKSLLRLMSDSSLSDLYPYFSVLSFICLGLLLFTLLRYRRASLYE